MEPTEGAWPRVVKVMLDSFDDIVLLASSFPIPILHYSEVDDAYFLLVTGPGGGILIYYVKNAERPRGRYIHIDKISGRYSFGNTLSLEPNHVSVLVLRIRQHRLGEL